MGKLFDKAKEQETLHRAWHRIRANGRCSSSSETRAAIEQFDQSARKNILQLQSEVRSGFVFDPQIGVTKNKFSGGKRGLVLASVKNRILERAILDTLQSKNKFVQQILSQPTSVGGVPNRSVPHGLNLIDQSFKSGATHFVRSDISGFFDHIPRKKVLDLLGETISDERFLTLLNDATTVTLSNEKALGEDRRIFPTDDEGVAQGSPLSPLFGNILLYEFDQKMNGRDVVCIRYIDDFLILGKSESKVRKAYNSASRFLQELGMKCHDPFAARVDKNKSDFGHVSSGFVFLGYQCEPGLFQPSKAARQSICKSVDAHLSFGRRAISEVIEEESSFFRRQRYAQTLSLVDQVLRGWGQAFSYGNAPSTLLHLDQEIDEKLNNFHKWYSRHLEGKDWRAKRRGGGVGLLQDIKPKTFDNVPFSLEKPPSVRVTSKMITISTDGSAIVQGRARGKNNGPGGWAFVCHNDDYESSGKEPSTTNNRMELTAVIQALKYTPQELPILIRTDSKYVHDIVNRGNIIKFNNDLWRDFQALSSGRRLKIVWVRGHSGDVYNERADKLAGERANEMAAELRSR